MTAEQGEETMESMNMEKEFCDLIKAAPDELLDGFYQNMKHRFNGEDPAKELKELLRECKLNDREIVIKELLILEERERRRTSPEQQQTRDFGDGVTEELSSWDKTSGDWYLLTFLDANDREKEGCLLKSPSFKACAALAWENNIHPGGRVAISRVDPRVRFFIVEDNYAYQFLNEIQMHLVVGYIRGWSYFCNELERVDNLDGLYQRYFGTTSPEPSECLRSMLVALLTKQESYEREFIVKAFLTFEEQQRRASKA